MLLECAAREANSDVPRRWVIERIVASVRACVFTVQCAQQLKQRSQIDAAACSLLNVPAITCHVRCCDFSNNTVQRCDPTSGSRLQCHNRTAGYSLHGTYHGLSRRHFTYFSPVLFTPGWSITAIICRNKVCQTVWQAIGADFLGAMGANAPRENNLG